MLDRVGVCAVVSASVGEGGKMLDGLSCLNAQFQWAPTLGGECYSVVIGADRAARVMVSMGTHPWG